MFNLEDYPLNAREGKHADQQLFFTLLFLQLLRFLFILSVSGKTTLFLSTGDGGAVFLRLLVDEDEDVFCDIIMLLYSKYMSRTSTFVVLPFVLYKNWKTISCDEPKYP